MNQSSTQFFSLKSFVLFILLNFCLAINSSAQCEGFSGEFDPTNWTITTDTEGFPFDVNLAEVIFTPTEMLVRTLDTGGSDGADLDYPLNAAAEIVIPFDGTLSFDYEMNDGDPGWDWFAISLDGVLLAGNNQPEIGSINVNVTAGQILHIGIDDDGCCSFLNPTELSITNFTFNGGSYPGGNIMFVSQSQIDAWSPCYSTITGSLIISGYDITDLSPLSNITTISDGLYIYYNPSTLTSLNGLHNLTSVGSLSIFYNFGLADCCALYSLLDNNGVAGSTSIFFNASGCNSSSEILNNCTPLLLESSPNTQVQVTIGTSSNYGAIKELNILPNPVSTQFTAHIPERYTTGKLVLSDIHGRQISQKYIAEGVHSYSFERFDLPSGIYILSLIPDEHSVHAVKVIFD